MASVAKTAMDIFNEESNRLLDDGNYEGSFAMSNAESMVNNFLHGRSTGEWVELTIRALTGNAQDSDNAEARDAYLEAIDLLNSLTN